MKGAKLSRRKRVGWGQFPFPFSWVQSPELQVQSGISGTTQPPFSLLFKEAEALETETKLFEDLEFQQLERESRAEEERELAGQGLLRSKAELFRSIAKRKVCPTPFPGTQCRVELEASDLGLHPN